LQAGRLQDDLDDVRDEVVYLKVKLRKEGSVSRSEYTEVRDRVQDLRSRARTNTERVPAPIEPSGGSSSRGNPVPIEDDRPRPSARTNQSGIPVGTEL